MEENAEEGWRLAVCCLQACKRKRRGESSWVVAPWLQSSFLDVTPWRRMKEGSEGAGAGGTGERLATELPWTADFCTLRGRKHGECAPSVVGVYEEGGFYTRRVCACIYGVLYIKCEAFWAWTGPKEAHHESRYGVRHMGCDPGETGANAFM